MVSITVTIKQIASSARSWLKPESGFATWIYPGVPLALCLMILISIGPSAQFYAFSALNARTATVYEAAHQQNITNYGTLGAWLATSLAQPYLITGLITAFLAMRHRSVQTIATASGAWLAVTVTIGDLAVALVTHTISASAMIVNIAANMIGGVIVAMVVFIAVGCATNVRWPSTSNRLTLLARSGIIVGGGIVVAACFFYILVLFYQPLRANFEAVMQPPQTGNIIPFQRVEPLPRTLSKDDSALAARLASFSWLPQLGAAARFSMEGNNLPTHITIGANDKYHSELRIYDGCFRKDVIDLPTAQPLVSFDGAFPVQLDQKGVSAIYTSSLSNVSYSPRSDKVMMYWLDRPTKDGSRRVSTFGGEGNVDIAAMDSTTIVLSTLLFDKAGDKKIPTSRHILLKIGSRQMTILIVPSAEVNLAKSAQCQPASLKRQPEKSDGANLVVSPSSPFVAVALTVKPKKAKSFEIHEGNADIRIAGLDGFVDFEMAKEQILPGGALGTLSSIAFGGGGPISDVQIEDDSLTVRPYDRFTAIGEISAAYLDDGAIRLSGTADQLWKNDRRLNATRWEELTSEMQVLLLGIFATALAFFARSAWPLAMATRYKCPSDTEDEEVLLEGTS